MLHDINPILRPQGFKKGKWYYYTINYPAIFDAQFNWILEYSSLFPKNVKQVPFRQDFYLN
jgi:hypothetical protein